METIPDPKYDVCVNEKITSAIDLLISTNSTKVDIPTVQLTECSPDIDVIMNKQGGICTKCETLFKSKVSLVNHVKKCIPNSYSSLLLSLPEKTNYSPSTPKIVILNSNAPRLIIVD